MTTLTKTLTFDEMVKLEPRLAALKERAFVTWQSRRWSRQELLRNWYRGIKPAMVKLVGFGAAVPELRNTQAYDFAYQYLYGILTTGREVN